MMRKLRSYIKILLWKLGADYFFLKNRIRKKLEPGIIEIERKMGITRCPSCKKKVAVLVGKDAICETCADERWKKIKKELRTDTLFPLPPKVDTGAGSLLNLRRLFNNMAVVWNGNNTYFSTSSFQMFHINKRDIDIELTGKWENVQFTCIGTKEPKKEKKAK